MKLNLFCKHNRYEVLTWKYQNLNRDDQKIVARVRCLDCGKIVEKVIEGDSMSTFAFVYDDKYAL